MVNHALLAHAHEAQVILLAIPNDCFPVGRAVAAPPGGPVVGDADRCEGRLFGEVADPTLLLRPREVRDYKDSLRNLIA